MVFKPVFKFCIIRINPADDKKDLSWRSIGEFHEEGEYMRSVVLAKLGFIGLIVLLIGLSIGASLVFADGSIGLRKELVEKSNMYVIVANINSPWNGEATYARKTYFYWQFGSLVSASRYVSLETTLTARDGVNVFMARLADVAVYDVYLDGTYLDRMAEVEQLYPEWYIDKYESAGDKIDDACISVVTQDTSGNKLGEHTICAIYSTKDGKITLGPGIETSFTITYDESYETEISMSISVKYISLNGIFKTNIQSGTTEKVEYFFKAPSDRTVTYLIDYLGPYDRDRDIYPIEWAFYTIDPPSSSSANIKEVETPIKYYLHVVTLDVHGKLINKKTVIYKTPPIIHERKRVKLIDINMGNGVILLIPRIENISEVKSATIKIWKLNTVNGKVEIKLPLGRAPDVVISALEILRSGLMLVKDRGSAVKIVLDVTYRDGSSDGFMYIAVGYGVSMLKS